MRKEGWNEVLSVGTDAGCTSLTERAQIKVIQDWSGLVGELVGRTIVRRRGISFAACRPLLAQALGRTDPTAPGKSLSADRVP